MSSLGTCLSALRATISRPGKLLLGVLTVLSAQLPLYIAWQQLLDDLALEGARAVAAIVYGASPTTLVTESALAISCLRLAVIFCFTSSVVAVAISATSHRTLFGRARAALAHAIIGCIGAVTLIEVSLLAASGARYMFYYPTSFIRGGAVLWFVFPLSLILGFVFIVCYVLAPIFLERHFSAEHRTFATPTPLKNVVRHLLQAFGDAATAIGNSCVHLFARPLSTARVLTPCTLILAPILVLIALTARSTWVAEPSSATFVLHAGHAFAVTIALVFTNQVLSQWIKRTTKLPG